MQKIKLTIPDFSFKPKSRIGLDIGAHSIKVVELQERSGRHVLKNIGFKEIPMEHRVEGKGDINFFARLIRELFDEMGIKRKDVYIAIPGNKVTVKVIKVVHMPESELPEAIKWEMRRYIQFPVAEAIFDCYNLGLAVEEGITKFKLLVAAVQKSAVNEYLAIIEEAGLSPRGIDIAPFAVWKTFKNVEILSDGKGVVLVDIGYRRTSISLVAEGTLQFTRDAKIGGDSFTEALLAPIAVGDTRVKLEYDEAEGLKQRYGIPPCDNYERTEENISLVQIYLLMRPVLEKLAVEIGRSIDFFARQLNVTNIDKIILSGGGALLKGLPESLSRGLNLNVVVTNPFHDIIAETKGDGDAQIQETPSSFAVAVGLASSVGKQIDLLPQEIKVKRQMVVQGATFAIASVILLLIFAVLYWGASRKLSALRAELSEKKAQLASIAAPATKLPRLMELREKVRREKTLLPKEQFVRYPWTAILKEISHAIPPRAMLTSLTVDTESYEVSDDKKATEKLIRLRGVIFDKQPDDRMALNGFIRSMEASPLFHNIKLVYTHDTIEYEQSGKNFEFVCTPALLRNDSRQTATLHR